MSILHAYVLPHPPLAVPAVGRGQEEKIKKTLTAFDQAAKEIAAIAPETIILITPHSVVYGDYFHISPGNGASGDFSRFGVPASQMEAIKVSYDVPLAQEISQLAANKNIPAGPMGEPLGPTGEPDPTLDHGVLVPLWYINQAYRDYKLVRIAQSAMEPAMHYRLGQVIAEAAEKTGRKTLLIASGDLSHKLSDDGPYGRVPEGAEYDRAATDALSKGDFLGLFNIPTPLREKAAECGHNSFVVMAGCFDRRQVEAKLLSYEGPFGVGYAVGSFKPKEADRSRNILEQYEEGTRMLIEKLREKEDPYQALARLSLEHVIKTGGTLPVPNDLIKDLLDNKAGVFVSLHKNGRLRGCIGTISPSTENIAREIIQNAVSAGMRDSRFETVTADELPLITYKVDVLAEPEPISNSSMLDVKRYGVIVSSGHRRGLLLPNLDGIDTVDQQISVARQKAGIGQDEEIKLERFEVVRHG